MARSLSFVMALEGQPILLRDGAIMTSFAVDGLAASTVDEVEIAAILSSLVAQQIPDIGFYVHRVATGTSPKVDQVSGRIPLAAAVDLRWQIFGVAGLMLRTTLESVTIQLSKVMGLRINMSVRRRQT